MLLSYFQISIYSAVQVVVHVQHVESLKADMFEWWPEKLAVFLEPGFVSSLLLLKTTNTASHKQGGESVCVCVCACSTWILLNNLIKVCIIFNKYVTAVWDNIFFIVLKAKHLLIYLNMNTLNNMSQTTLPRCVENNTTSVCLFTLNMSLTYIH